MRNSRGKRKASGKENGRKMCCQTVRPCKLWMTSSDYVRLHHSARRYRNAAASFSTKRLWHLSETRSTASSRQWVSVRAEADLVDVELGDRAVEKKIEIVQHRDDLHRSALTGERRERHYVREVDGRLGKYLRINGYTGLQLFCHTPTDIIQPNFHVRKLSNAAYAQFTLPTPTIKTVTSRAVWNQQAIVCDNLILKVLGIKQQISEDLCLCLL